MALTTRLTTTVVASHTSSLDLSTPSDPLDYMRRVTLASGTGSGQADLIWHDQRTLASEATEDIDLAGSLTDSFGTTLTFVKLKALIVAAASTNTNNVNVTRPAANGVPLFLAAGDGVPVLPGGHNCWVAPGAGVTVTAGTGDLITFTNSSSGSTVTYDVIIIGTSA